MSNTPDDPDRFTIEPLTREVAERLGHIAWIEDADPVSAFRRMAAAVRKEPVNCAIWANADAGEEVGWRKEVAAWRVNGNAGLYFTPIPESSLRASSRSEAMAGLTATFSSRILFAEQAVPLCAWRHVTGRMHDIFQAVASGRGRFSFRAGPGDKTLIEPDTHCDGENTDMGPMERFRFLESVECRRTFLFGNNDAVLVRDEDEYGASGKEVYKYALRREGPVTGYEAPENSMVLITDVGLPWQPVLHDHTFLPKGQPQQKRTVFVHDFYCPRP
jgi:hypothetical protein